MKKILLVAACLFSTVSFSCFGSDDFFLRGSWIITYHAKIKFEEINTHPRSYDSQFILKFISNDIAELDFSTKKAILFWSLNKSEDPSFISLRLISKDNGNSILYLKKIDEECFYIVAKNENEEDLLFIGEMRKLKEKPL